jgi:hypothetical protein
MLKALAASSNSFRFDFENFDWGGEYYRRHGVMMPDDGLNALRDKDAILFGSAGDPDIPDHITLWGFDDRSTGFHSSIWLDASGRLSTSWYVPSTGISC